MSRKHFYAVVFIFLSALFASADKRPLQFEDLFGMKRLADVQVSPDGRWVAYVQTVYDIGKNNSNSDIWVVSLESGATRQLTTFTGPDSHPRWIEGGKEIAFLSTRSGSSQVWRIALDGGEARQVTHLYTGVDGFIWSPTGQFFIYSVEVWPDCPSDEANRKKDEEMAAAKCTGRIIDRLFYRQWNRWVNDKFSHLFYYDLATGKERELLSGKVNCPPLDLGTGHDFALSPDGTELAFVFNPGPEPAVNTNNEVYRLQLDSGVTLCLTRDNPADDCGPLYSPDGKYLAWLAMKRPGFEADKKDIILMDRVTGERRNLTAGWDRTVEDYIWSPDGRTLYLLAEDNARNAIFSVPAAGGQVKKILGDHYNSNLRITPDGKALVFLQQAANHPDDICALDLAGSRVQALTTVNEERLAQLEMNPMEEFTFTGAKSEAIHAIFIKPPQFDPAKKYPVVFIIHGGPQGAFGDEFHYRWNYQMFSAPGWLAVMINFHGSYGYGQKFTDAVSKDWGGAPYEDIMKGVDYFLAKYPFADSQRIAAAGASYGGFMINWIAGHTDRFRCLVSHDGVFDQRGMHGATEEVWFPEWEFNGVPWDKNSLYEKWSPCNFVENFKTPMLVVHSELDYRVPVTQGFQLFTALQRKGIESKMLYFPDEDHFVRKPQNARLWWKTVTEWISNHLK